MSLDSIIAWLEMNWQVLWAFGVGLMIGALWGVHRAIAAYNNHLETIRQLAACLGHLKAATELLDDEGLADEAQERGERYAESYLIDLETSNAHAPSRLDRLRDRLPFVERDE